MSTPGHKVHAIVVQLTDLDEYTGGEDRVPSVVRGEFISAVEQSYTVSDVRVVVRSSPNPAQR